ncbi:ComEC/Rec2 family competence protein [Rubrobacter indicoceani]|uniref:ComEC/Rec2 family competence protein n=1 Tax=Rubrobacter indicoceani TaxID=2051957 RepID=UPI000E5C1D79|nr:ComEC/Rec2 family competence protein [Rubrobacter indicoceani]
MEMRKKAAGPVRAVLLTFLCFASLSCGALAAAPGGSGVEPPPVGALSVSFIDVGQGDSILVQAGGESYLIDAGNPEEGPKVVDFLRSRGVDELDGMVATSGDADHSGGLADVLDAFTVENIYVSGYPKETLTYTNFLRTARNEVDEEGATFAALSTGTTLDWAGLRVDVLNPPAGGGEVYTGSNDSSVALLLTYGRARIIFAGDAEKKAEEYLAASPKSGAVTVMKVNHHGSNTSTTTAFLARYRPEVAVIQSGEDNTYGHPTPEVLKRLDEAGAEVFRTDLHGDVIVTIEQDDVEVAVTEP